MNLVIYDYWVNDIFYIIYCNKVFEFSVFGFCVYFYNGDMGIERIGKVGWIIEIVKV